MLITILTTIRFKVKGPIKKVPLKTNNKPTKLVAPMQILGHVIYWSIIAFLIFLIGIFGPWILYYIEMHY